MPSAKIHSLHTVYYYLLYLAGAVKTFLTAA
jgi:hypothetical protein